jgi:hypothetical protein
MKRREFIAGLAGTAAWPIAARAQQPALPVIGFMSARGREDSEYLVAAFWPAPGSEDTELGVILEPEVVYGTQTLCTRVQA